MTKLISSIFNSRWTLVGIIAASVCFRIASAIYLGDQMVNLPGTFDQVSYHNLATRLLDGHGFSFGTQWWPFTAANAPTSHWSFLYTYYLALVYGLFGPQPLIARLIQAVFVGVLHPYLAYSIARRLFNQHIAIITALLTSVYLYFIYYSGTLMTEPFYMTAILASLLLVVKLADIPPDAQNASRRDLWAIGLGLTLGAAVLFRQIFLVIIPLIYVWLWLVGRKSNTRITLRVIIITTIIITLLIIPFTIFNYVRFNRFVLLNTNAGFAFYWANHPIYGTQFVPILRPEMGSYQDLVPVELRSLDEATLDQTLLRKGLQFVLDDPWRYLLLSASRIPWYFMFWPSEESAPISNISRVLSFGLYLPLMAYGVILSLPFRTRRLREFLETPNALMLGIALCYSLIHIFSWTLIRYRLPVDAILILFASYAVWDLWRRVGQRRNRMQEIEIIRPS